jgi:Vps52 / Sac2 family
MVKRKTSDILTFFSRIQQKEDVEALLRSALLVLMDNGTSEYVFVTTFFAPEPVLPLGDTLQVAGGHLFSPTSPGDGPLSGTGTESIPATARPRDRTDSVFSTESVHPSPRLSKEDQASLNAIWKQIMDPALEHTKVGSLHCHRVLFLLIHQPTNADICKSCIGTSATCDTSPYDDPTYRRGHGRDTEARLPTTGDVCFWH